jgi:hypothetical protein
MLDRQELYSRRCVRTLVEIIEQMPSRWAARAPMVLDESTAGLLLLWTIIRWERRFPLTLLEEMNITLWPLTKAIDQLIEDEKTRKSAEYDPSAVKNPDHPEAKYLLRDYTDRWLRRAEEQSQALGHSFVGAEHLLLALVACAYSTWTPIFAEYGLDYERLKNAIVQALSAKTDAKPPAADENPLPPIMAELALPKLGTAAWGAAWDRRPATGMPRKFSIAIMMTMVTLFAVLFSLFRCIHAPPVIYGVFGVLVFGVAVGQMVLFGGNYPRAASIWTGAFLLPVEVACIIFFSNEFTNGNDLFSRFFLAIFVMIYTIPIGAFFGYSAGALTGGVVLLLERKNNSSSPESDDQSFSGPKEFSDDQEED